MIVKVSWAETKTNLKSENSQLKYTDVLLYYSHC